MSVDTPVDAAVAADVRTLALIYVRVSRLEAAERERALSPQMQAEHCRALPALRGHELEIIEDLDCSGKDTRRPGFQRLVALLRGGRVQVVAAYSLSRISRSVADFYRFYEEVLRPFGVAFVSATEAIDTSSPQGRAFMGMTAVWAQMEREQTSQRIADSLESKATRGELVGPVPLGYRREVGLVVIDEPAAELVRLIFHKYASGTYTMRRLAIWLNDQGYRPLRGHKNNREAARVFTPDVLKDILKNPRYMGKFRHRTRRGAGPLIQGTYPALIDEPTWEACCAVREQHLKRHISADGRKGRRRYPLSPLLRCARCGGSVRGDTRGKDHLYYACSLHRSVGLCDQPMARVDAIDRQLRAALGELRWPEGAADYFARAMRARLSKPEKAADPQQRLAALKARLARLGERYDLGDLPHQQYLAERSRLLAEMEKATAAPVPEVNLAERATELRSLVDHWDELDNSERGRLLATIFEKLELEGRRIVAATPRAGWLPYFGRVFLERKTGLQPASYNRLASLQIDGSTLRRAA